MQFLWVHIINGRNIGTQFGPNIRFIGTYTHSPKLRYCPKIFLLSKYVQGSSGLTPNDKVEMNNNCLMKGGNN